MTESDIYQIVGQAYCAGLSEGMEKSAAFEKQALGPESLLNALKGIAGKGNVVRTMNTIGRITPRVSGALSSLKDAAEVPSLLNNVQKTDISNALDAWNKLSDRMGSLGGLINRMTKTHTDSTYPFNAGLRAARGLDSPYYNSILKKLIKMF